MPKLVKAAAQGTYSGWLSVYALFASTLVRFAFFHLLSLIMTCSPFLRPLCTQVNMSNFDLVMESDLGTFTPIGLQFTGSDAAQKVILKPNYLKKIVVLDCEFCRTQILQTDMKIASCPVDVLVFSLKSVKVPYIYM